MFQSGIVMHKSSTGRAGCYTAHMAKREKLSLAPLTPDEAMRALLKVDPKDVAKLEARERRKKAAGKKKRGK
jgi:hypothetical protein